MNYTLIGLGIILCVLIYVMYEYLNRKGNQVGSNMVTLNATTSNPSVSYSLLSDPTSSRYNLSFWINVNNLPSESTIFDIKTGTASNLKVFLTTDSTLKYTIMSASDPNSIINHIIIPDFPLQKWVYVILSIDGKVVDTYIDGKMIRSEALSEVPTLTDKNSNIVFGNPPSLIYLTKFNRTPSPMDPGLAWSSYMAGNGGNSFSMFSSYGANFTLTKDNLDVNKMALF